MCKHFLTHNEVGPWSFVAYDDDGGEGLANSLPWDLQ